MSSEYPFGQSTGVSFVGVRTDKLDAMEVFFRDILGYQQTRREHEFYTFLTPAGQRIELFGHGYPGREHLTTGPFPGFEVADFDAALAWLETSGLEILIDPQHSSSGSSWVHFRGPDGNVYELVHHAE